MCGIYGFIGQPTKDTANLLETLGLLNESRGRDSAGLAIVSKNTHEVYKQAVSATQFFNDYHKSEKIDNHSGSEHLIIMGHTRMRTHGAVTKENAHPFRIGSIVFTHNGIIYNFDTLQAEAKTDYQVDSQIIGYYINKLGPQQAFKKLSGSFTVPYVDLEEADCLGVAVHSQVFAYAIKGNQVFYSSEKNHLKVTLKGQGFKIREGVNNTLYKFYPLGKGIAVSTEKIATAPYIYSGYTYSPSYYDYTNYYKYNRKSHAWKK